VPAAFVNVIEPREGGVVVLARFGRAHATVGASVSPSPRREPGRRQPE
jgi:hypothetical protein